MAWQDIHLIIVSGASVFTSLGVIIATFRWWGKKISKRIVNRGLEELTLENIPEKGIFAELRSDVDYNRQCIARIEHTLIDIHKRTLRNEILNLIKSHPKDIEMIERLYEEYKGHGYNGYIQELVESWRKNSVRKTISKKR